MKETRCDGGDDEDPATRVKNTTEMLTYTFNLISKSETDRIVDFLISFIILL